MNKKERKKWRNDLVYVAKVSIRGNCGGFYTCALQNSEAFVSNT